MAQVTEKQAHILLHSLGLSPERRTIYRNHFVTGEESDDHAHCMALVEMGLMQRRSGNALSGGDDVFLVTDAGTEAARSSLPPPPKLSRSAKRYRAWLAEDSSMPFGQWIRSRA